MTAAFARRRRNPNQGVIAMSSRSAVRNSLHLTLLLLLLLLVNIVTVADGADESRLTVANLTEHYVHIFIEGETYLYVAPQRSVAYTTSAKPTMLVEIVYAPGQGVRGSAVDTVAVPYRSSQSGCSCEEGDSWGDCIYEPPSGGTARIEVRPEDMLPEE